MLSIRSFLSLSLLLHHFEIYSSASITMSAITGHLMRRGAEVASFHLQTSDKNDMQLSGGQIALLALTTWVMLVALWAVSRNILQPMDSVLIAPR